MHDAAPPSSHRRARWSCVHAGMWMVAGLLPVPAIAVDPGALPDGARVVAGSAGVASEGRTLTVTQTSQRAILEWRSFDIGSAATVHFQQPGASSVALNRVIGGDASRIEGRLSATGHVYLVNTAGVLFGRGARVDAGRLVTSTLDMADGDFLAGRERFEPAQGLAAMDQLQSGGDASRLSQQVAGALADTAAGPRDQQAGAPRQLTMDAGANGHLRFGLAADEIDALLQNGGLVEDADGLVLTSQGASALASAVVARDDAPQARRVTRRDGRILLLAGGGDATGIAEASTSAQQTFAAQVAPALPD